LRLPVAPSAVPAVDVSLSGVPFDGGCSYRPGARFGPGAVREASALARTFSPALGVDVFDELSAVDGGDVIGLGPDVSSTLNAVAERAEALARSGVISGFIGGDQTLTLGALRGIKRAKHKSLALLHFDAHPNTSPPTHALPIHHTSVIRNALEEGLLRPDAALQIGVRGPYASAEEGTFGSSRGFEIIGLDEVRLDLHAVVSQVRRLVGRGSLYVSVDVSVLDPAYAPGTGMPSPGGMSTWELQQLLRALVGAEIIGFDVVEIAPVYDPAAITPLAGVAIIQEILAAIADTRRSGRPAPSTHRVASRGRKLSP
jgi:agmatinase